MDNAKLIFMLLFASIAYSAGWGFIMNDGEMKGICLIMIFIFILYVFEFIMEGKNANARHK